MKDWVKQWMKDRGLKRHILEAVPTGYSCGNTGRIKYRVECLSCCDVLHDNTSNPGMIIQQHLEEAELVSSKR